LESLNPGVCTGWFGPSSTWLLGVGFVCIPPEWNTELTDTPTAIRAINDWTNANARNIRAVTNVSFVDGKVNEMFHEEVFSRPGHGLPGSNDRNKNKLRTFRHAEDPTFPRRSGRILQWVKPHAPTALYTLEDSWYSFLLQADPTPGKVSRWRELAEKFDWKATFNNWSSSHCALQVAKKAILVRLFLCNQNLWFSVTLRVFGFFSEKCCTWRISQKP
jgi:hypothetical protein